MKSGWEKYATKEGLVKKGYFRKHCDGGSGRKAREASSRDSLQQSWKEQEKMRGYSCCNGHQFNAEESTHSLMGGHACPHCPVSRYMIPIKKQELEKKIEWFGRITEIKEELIYTGEENVKDRKRCEESSSETGVNERRPVRSKIRKGKNSKRKDERCHEEEVAKATPS